MHKRLWMFLLAILLIAAVAFALRDGHKTREPVRAPIREEAPVSPSHVGPLGRIEPRSRVLKVSHDAGPEGARIGLLKVAEGEQVEQGAVIAEFSDRPRKEASLNAARARMTMLEAKITAEETNTRYFAKEYDRVRTLANAKAVATARRDQAERDYAQSQALVASLRAELASAQAEAKLAEEEVRQSVLLAPMTGTIIKILAWPGERVGDRGVVEMADLTELDVVAEIYERDMPRVKAGQKAEIRVPGIATPFTGDVRELGYQVRKNDLNDTDPLADRDNRIVEVRITLPSQATEQLRHLLYMQVDVRLP